MKNIQFDFSEQNYVVTGASSGIGREIAKELAEAGATVLAIARRRDELDNLSAEVQGEIVPCAVDVCDLEDMRVSVDDFVKNHGKLNGAVHAAGIAVLTSVRNYDREAAHRMMDIGFWAGIDLVQLVSKKKNSVDGASFVLLSSADAKVGFKGKFAYAASKASVNIAVRSIAKEIVRRKQRINSIMPGWVDTPMTRASSKASNVSDILAPQLLGVIHPCDIASMAMFLLSDGALYITGANIPVDGGGSA